MGRRRERVTPGHRHPAGAHGARVDAGRPDSATRPPWCTPPAITRTSPPSPRSPTATPSSSPTPTCTPRSSTRAGSPAGAAGDRRRTTTSRRRGAAVRAYAGPRPGARRVDLLRARRRRAAGRARRAVRATRRDPGRRRGPRHRRRGRWRRTRTRAGPGRPAISHRHDDALQGARQPGRRGPRQRRPSSTISSTDRGPSSTTPGSRPPLPRPPSRPCGSWTPSPSGSRVCTTSPRRWRMRRVCRASPVRCCRCEMPGPAEALAAQAECARDGVRVGCFRPPSTPDGISRLRLTASAGVDDDDLAHAAKLIGTVVP